MARPIYLTLKKKTLVPTTKQIIHLLRSDWKQSAIFNYNDSNNLFNIFDKDNPLETDAQFCKYIYDNFGKGIYLVLMNRKGQRGFRNFMKVEILKDRFKFLPKKPSKEEKEIRDQINDKENLKRQRPGADSEQRKYIEEDIEDTDDEITELKKGLKKTKSGCSPYLKITIPKYGWHSLEDYGSVDSEDEFIESAY